jgi:pimeloyl-ACP methyl ester carboxylesterase
MSPPTFKPPFKTRPQGARKRGAHDVAEISAPGDRPLTTHGYIKSFDGTRLFYGVEGRGKPLLFCYGLVCSSLHWTYQIEHFRKNYQTIWFDYRGHNNSETPRDLRSLTVETLARDLGIILDELGIKDPVPLLGHSMGVNTILEFYRQQPDRVHSLVLANGTPRRPLETLFRSNVLQMAFQLLGKAYRRSPELVVAAWKLQKGNPFARTMIRLGGFNPYLTPPEDIALYVDQVADMDPSILIHLIENYDNLDMTSWLHTIKQPTLIIAGQDDKITPLENQELMKQLIPNSELEIVKHGSHCPQMDLPEQVNLRIEKFLASINYVTEPIPTKESASQSTDPSPSLELGVVS